MTSAIAVIVRAGDAALPGELKVPDEPAGVVVFAHGSGSSRHSPRNQAVAGGLAGAGFGTLLFDLLTPEEERADMRTSEFRFDIGLLARRLTGAIDWLDGQPAVRDLPRGLFGASTGAAAALTTAAQRPGHVRAVVSRGGRPDLAGPALGGVLAPVLLIVGGRDTLVRRLNEDASRELNAPCELAIVPGAGHLFEEPGTLEQVTALAASWFARCLTPSADGD